MSVVTQPIPERYQQLYVDTACRLVHQMFTDNNADNPLDGSVTSRSEKSGDYSYSEAYDTSKVGMALYRSIVISNMTRYNGEFTGLFYGGLT
jgi:hypothetical protein